MRGDIRRMLFAAASLCVCAAFVAVACGPLGGDDDDDDAASGDSGVVMSTYTPTVPGSTPQAVLTLEAQQTAAVQTATEQAINPPPSTAVAGNSGQDGTAPPGGDPGSNPSGTTAPPIMPTSDPLNPQTPSDTLAPPDATLVVGGEQIEGGLGPYAWQWDDPLMTYFEIPSTPLMQITDVALTIQSGADAEIQFSGDALKQPPDDITLELFDYDDNTAIPVDQSGNTMGDGGLAFAPKADPITTLKPDPANPATFTADFAPGHYILRLRADWPEPEQLTKPGGTIFVSYTFNIIVE